MFWSERAGNERVLEVRAHDFCAAGLVSSLGMCPTTQHVNWEKCSDDFGIYWPDIDGDLSAEALLRRAPDARTV